VHFALLSTVCLCESVFVCVRATFSASLNAQLSSVWNRFRFYFFPQPYMPAATLLRCCFCLSCLCLMCECLLFVRSILLNPNFVRDTRLCSFPGSGSGSWLLAPGSWLLAPATGNGQTNKPHIRTNAMQI